MTPAQPGAPGRRRRRPRGWLSQAGPGIAAATIIVGCDVIARRRWRELPALDPQRRRDDLTPIVDVVVPVRDQAGEISGCVLSLWAAGANRVIVVDDASSDASARIAVAVGAEVITIKGAPPDWEARPYSCWVGAQRATAGWLAWVDADVRLAPGCLDALVEVCEREGLDAASPVLLRPSTDLTDRLTRPLAGWLEAVATPRFGRGLLRGQCLLVRRVAYDREGGHAEATVRRSSTEDVALARRLARAGRVGLVAGDAAGIVRTASRGRRSGARAGLGQVLRRGIDPVSTATGATAAAGLVAMPLLLGQAAWRATPGRVIGAAAAYASAATALAADYRRAGDRRLTLLHPLASLLWLSIDARALMGRRTALDGGRIMLGAVMPRRRPSGHRVTATTRPG